MAPIKTFEKKNSRDEFYQDLLETAQSLYDPKLPFIANLSNFSALLFYAFKDNEIPVNWSGFYLRDKILNNRFILGPFQGKVACSIIPIGKGVCGTAAKNGKPEVVPDTHSYVGHITCDYASLSEIVIPIMVDGNCVMLLDIDSYEFRTFGDVDLKWLMEFGEFLKRVYLENRKVDY
ncbi:hypothetical protein HDV04_000961 [Boothiomyces sp. JEL0838]|nr:hypothetical protein HDV04_000961 [Boothiomyces sp. JEL0838]